jgi:hypothetical protein
MRSRSLLLCSTLALGLQGCTRFHYTDHQILVMNLGTQQPIPNASINVSYAPVQCGGPFAFLGSPKIPSTPAQVTDASGTASVPLELDWPYGFTMVVEAAGFQRSELTRPRDAGSPRPAPPRSIELNAQP